MKLELALILNPEVFSHFFDLEPVGGRETL